MYFFDIVAYGCYSIKNIPLVSPSFSNEKGEFVKNDKDYERYQKNILEQEGTIFF